MKILFTSQSYYPFLEKGGPATKIPSIASGLASRGHLLTVITADLGLERSVIQLRAQNLDSHSWGSRATVDGVEACYFRSMIQHRALSLNPDVIGFLRINLQDFSIAHIYGLYDLFGPVAAFYCSRRRVPYVLEPMGMMKPIVRSIGLKRFYQFVLGRRLVRNARYLIATSEQERQEFLELGVANDKIVVRRNGIEAPQEIPARGVFRSKFNISPKEKLVLFLGRISAKKSPDLLIEAFARWKNNNGGRGMPTVLAIAGPEEDPAFKTSLVELAVRLGVREAVRFTGPIYGEARWNAYRDADVFVLPSQNENFGNTVAESAACGTPVIVTDRCGVAPYVRGRAGQIISHNVEALERALSDFLGDPGIRERFRDGCRAMTRELSWSGPIVEMESLYQRCLQEA